MKCAGNMYATILDGDNRELVIDLSEFDKNLITFGRDSENDIVLQSKIVSKRHGYFTRVDNQWVIFDNDSTNGLIWNSVKIPNKRLMGGDKFLIGNENRDDKVAFVFSKESPDLVRSKFNMDGKKIVTIGRGTDCDICLAHPAIFKNHCRIVADGDSWYLERASAKAPIQFNGADLAVRQKLSDMDRFLIGDTQFIYQNKTLHYIRLDQGLSFEVSSLYKTVGSGKKKKDINQDINFSVNAGELVAIIGGSGAGKSTLLNCLCGCSKISKGNVTIGGEDLTANYNSLKNLIGYVPQQDIVYDNLTLEKMLYYTAKLRVPEDYGEAEINSRIENALKMVKLLDKKDLLIKSLSGGQKKRASIAVELISDPKLFFLDEPTSGLDPGTERNLMLTLKEMTEQGKTVVLVTHTPLNLNLCDKIVIMGKDGRLCYCGSPEGVNDFFDVNNIVEVYDLINNDSATWAAKYKENTADFSSGQSGPDVGQKANDKTRKASALRQTVILVQRYVDLQIHDVRRLVINGLMAPGLGFLLYIAFRDSFPFEVSWDTQKLMMTLSCCAFWIGLFNTIQEVCKESQIYRREQMANLKIIPYISSKIIVNGVFELLQTILLVMVVGVFIGMPESGMQMPSAPAVEIFITTYLTMLSATCIGLLVSTLVSNSDQAISVAPVLLIPQILFSGVVVELDGAVDKISYIISCRYACNAYCTTADINNLASYMTMTALGYEKGSAAIVSVKYSYLNNYSSAVANIFGDDFAQALTNPVMGGWIALLIISFVALAAAVIVLNQKKKAL